MIDTIATRIRFADCELDVASREFRRAGEMVPIEPRVFALLEFLIENRDRAVNKDEIQDAVWKGTIVSETALTRAIMKARRAVGDSADNQAVIRTVHGHGYQFVAALIPEAETETAIVESSAPGNNMPRILALAVAAVLAAFIAFIWPTSAPGQTVRLAIMPVVNATNDAEYDWTRLGLMGYGNDLINRAAVMSILPASDVVRFAEHRRAATEDDGLLVADDLEQLQTAYGASHMLVSKLEQSAGGLRLTYSLYMPDGETDRGTMVGTNPTELMRGMVYSVSEILSPRDNAANEITVVSEDPFLNEAYSRGLGLSLEGRCAEALQLFEVLTSSEDTVGEAEYQWANCARILGRWQEAESGFRKIIAGLPAEPATTLKALAMNGLGTVYLRTGRGDAAKETFELGLAEAVSAGDNMLQGMLLNSMAIEAYKRREFSAARDLLDRAIVLHSESDAGVLPGQIPSAIANIDMAEGRLEKADDRLQQALDSFRALGDRRNEAMMLNNRGYLRRLQGRPGDAEPLHLQSLEIRREIGDVVGQGRILGMLSILYNDAGDLDKARDAASQAYEIASKANDKLFVGTSLAQLAGVEMKAGNVDLARETYRKSATVFGEIDDYSRVAQVTLRLAKLDLQVGDLAGAEAIAGDVLTLSMREALPEPAIEALELSGDIARAKPDPDLAVSSYQRALEHIDETGFVDRQTEITIKLANLLLDIENVVAAEPLIGYLIQQDDTPEIQELRSRYRSASGED